MQKVFVPLLVSAYFQRRMKWLRSHITRITTILFVGAGFSLFLIQPAHLHQKSDALANCLEQMAKLPETSDVKKELDVLQQSSANFSQFVEKTAQLINQNPQAFDASLVDLAVSSHLYKLFFREWNELKADFETNGLLRFSIRNSFQSGRNTQANLLGSFGLMPDFLLSMKQFRKKGITVAISLAVLRFARMLPMSSGIAIGAP